MFQLNSKVKMKKNSLKQNFKLPFCQKESKQTIGINLIQKIFKKSIKQKLELEYQESVLNDLYQMNQFDDNRNKANN